MARKKGICPSGIGGQAVLEGVMMKNQDLYAVAVRKPDGEIEIDTEEYHGVLHGSPIKKIPFVRGVFNFVDSLILGMRTLTYSATFYEEEESKETKTDKMMGKLFGEKTESVMMGLTVAFSIILAVAIFMVLPFLLSSFFERYVRNTSLLALIEGVIRIAIFLIYVVAISLMQDIKRVYMYHGAEHKCINCIEHGHVLNVHNVKKSSRLHRRCGTSFLLIVMIVSVILFILIRVENPLYRLGIRLLLIPVIAGISYEIIRLAGRSENVIVKIISAPGLALQKLTTREPDDDMIEVAIKSVEAVFDWRAFLGENFDYEEYKKESADVEEVAKNTGVKAEVTDTVESNEEASANMVVAEKVAETTADDSAKKEIAEETNATVENNVDSINSSEEVVSEEDSEE